MDIDTFSIIITMSSWSLNLHLLNFITKLLTRWHETYRTFHISVIAFLCHFPISVDMLQSYLNPVSINIWQTCWPVVIREYVVPLDMNPLDMKGCVCHKVADTPFHIQGNDVISNFVKWQIRPFTPQGTCDNTINYKPSLNSPKLFTVNNLYWI